MTDEIKIILKVTPESFDEHFSIDDWLNLGDMSNKDVYDKMIHFVVDENGEYLSVDDARKLFKKIPKKEWNQHVSNFYQSITEAFVSPTTGGG